MSAKAVAERAAAPHSTPGPLDGAGEGMVTRAEMLQISELLQADIDAAVEAVREASAEALAGGERMAGEAREIAAEAQRVSSAANEAGENVAAVASAAEEISASGREIAREAARSAAAAQRSVAETETAAKIVEELVRAAEGISRIVGLIEDVASRTNLLALNATIEAARAGVAGRGFAVVAGEVKALSGQTKDATRDIARRVEEIQGVTRRTAEMIAGLGAAVREIEAANTGVANAVNQQGGAVDEIARSIQVASQRVSEVATTVGVVSQRVESIESSAAGAAGSIKKTHQRIEGLRANIVVSLRGSKAGDRRQSERVPVQTPGRFELGSSERPGTIQDLSLGGALFRPADGTKGILAGVAGRLAIDGAGTFGAAVTEVSRSGVHLRFEKVGELERARLSSLLASASSGDARFIEIAKEAAGRIEAALAAAVAEGKLTRAALFDTAYKPIAGTDPQQFETRSVAVLDRILPPIQEPVLALDKRIQFCAAVDRNGYLPTHNRKFSEPQRPGDPDWNALHSRNRRIFDDRAGLAAARTSRDHLVQTYDRDLGYRKVTLSEVDVPIRVDGQHWGALRLAYTKA